MINTKRISALLLFLAVFSAGAHSQKPKKIDLAKKIAEATPKPLPQTPVVQKARSDAQDNNLKGKVKSVVQDTQEAGKTVRERSSEEHYDENGNLLKEISYLDGYPSTVIVWGYIDGKRVSKAGTVVYAEGERPPTDGIFAVMDEEQEAANPNAPRDRRYGLQYAYKYDDQNRLIEKWTYQNNGEVWARTEYVYQENLRITSYFGRDGARWSQGFEILDKNGNATEQYSMSDGKTVDETVFTRRFDARGNWIVERSFEKKKVRGKIVLEPLWTTYRAIAYYR